MNDQLLFGIAQLGKTRRFVKINGLGNDFVAVDGRQQPFRPDVEMIKWICDRHRGVGADQLLVIEPARDQAADAFLRIYNIDGREAETCLNATRCAAWLLLGETGAETIAIQTHGGVIHAHGASGNLVSLTMSPPHWDWGEIPLAHPVSGNELPMESGPLKGPVPVNLGNPHIVCFVENWDQVDIPRFAPALQNHPLLPEGANVGVAELIAPDCLKLAVWERPGILTQACGSGACAAALIIRRLGMSNETEFTVLMPGGRLSVKVRPDESTVLTGAVEYSFGGRLPDMINEREELL